MFQGCKLFKNISGGILERIDNIFRTFFISYFPLLPSKQASEDATEFDWRRTDSLQLSQNLFLFLKNKKDNFQTQKQNRKQSNEKNLEN